MKKAQLGIKVSKKMNELQSMFTYFINHHWVFESVHSDKIWSLMSMEEKKEFNFDVGCIDWRKCIADYCFGIRRFYFKAELLQI